LKITGRSGVNSVSKSLLPRGGERAGLRLAVADDHGDDQLGIVERRAVRVRETVAELTAREGELPEELPEPLLVLALVRIDLRVGALEVHGPEDAGRAVSGAGDEDHVEVVAADEPVQVHVHEAQPRARAPVTEEPVLHVIRLERRLQQRVVLEIDHPDGEVVARPPVRVEPPELFLGQW
jgi:hypothetical protein